MRNFKGDVRSRFDNLSKELKKLAKERDPVLAEYNRANLEYENLNDKRRNAIGYATCNEISRELSGISRLIANLQPRVQKIDMEANAMISHSALYSPSVYDSNEYKAQCREAVDLLRKIYRGSFIDDPWYS